MNDYARAYLKSVVRTKFDIYVFISITGSILLLVDYLVFDDIIRPVVSASALTWFIIYFYYWNLQFLNNVIVNKTKVLISQA